MGFPEDAGTQTLTGHAGLPSGHTRQSAPSATLVTTSVLSDTKTGPSPNGTPLTTTSACIAQHTMCMTRITILDPTAAAPQTDADPGPSPVTLAGCTVGIRSDRTWRSFEWVADEWERALAADGAAVRRWIAGNRIGDEGERTRVELEAFVAANDVVVTGLGN